MPDIAITACWYLLIVLLIQQWPWFQIEGWGKSISILAFSLKCIAGWMLTWLYASVYNEPDASDIFKLFRDSEFIFNALPKEPLDYLRMVSGFNANAPELDVYYYQMNHWFGTYDRSLGNDTRTLIRFNALVRLFSFGVIHVHTVFMCFCAYLGLKWLYESFSTFVQKWVHLWLAACFLLPSLLFWSSGLLKEGLMFMALGAIVKATTKWEAKERSLGFLPWLIFGLALFSQIKAYVLWALFPSLVFIVACRLMRCIHPSRVFAGFLMAGIGLAVAAQFLPDAFNPYYLLAERQSEMLRLSFYLDSGSAVKATPMKANLTGLLQQIPDALVNSLFRPWPWEARGLLQCLASFENMFLLLIMVYALRMGQLPKWELTWFLALGIFIFIFLVSVGVSTPILGTLNRYRVPALPFLILLLMMWYKSSGKWKKSMLDVKP